MSDTVIEQPRLVEFHRVVWLDKSSSWRVVDTGFDYTHPDLAANTWVGVHNLPRGL